jgi:hypothetical protein
MMAMVLAWPAGAASVPVSPDSTRSGAAGLPIRQVVIEPHNIFDPLPPGRLRPFYRLANRLHVRTRSRTIREQLLFAPGDLWDDEVGRETMRNLRGLGFLFPDEIAPQVEGDSVTVTVLTRDAWTTAFDFNLESSGGERFGSVGLTEHNFLGLGKSISLSRHVEPSGVSRSVGFGDPAVFGTRMQFQFTAGKGTDGANNGVNLGVPFYAQETPTSWNVDWFRSTSVLRLYSGPQQVADLDERREETEVTWGKGRRRDGTIARGILSLLVRERRLGPSRADSLAPPDFKGGEENLHLRRLAAELVLWHPHFIERRDVDRMTGIEDFDVGALSSIKLGISPKALGGTENEAYAKFRLDLGTQTPYGFGWAHGSLESRFRWTPIETMRRLDARWVTTPVAQQRLILSVLGISGERTARDFQISIGGLNGLRAYPVHELTGTRVWRLVAEDRWIPPHTDTQLVALGAAVFCDAGRAWGPGAAGTGWHSDAGVGLRLATPRTSMRDVVRFDIAFPIEPRPGGKRSAVFSFGSSQAF